MSDQSKLYNDTLSRLLAILERWPQSEVSKLLQDTKEILFPEDGVEASAPASNPAPATERSTPTTSPIAVLKLPCSGTVEIYLSHSGMPALVFCPDVKTER